MTFLAKCGKCNESLRIDPTQREAVCPACNTPFVFERTTFNSEMADEAMLKAELIKKFDEKIAALNLDIIKLGAEKSEIETKINRRSILGKSSKAGLQDELALVEAKIEAAEAEILIAEAKKLDLYSNA
jgi:DNA-directed RNA polymerase subunit RPC12/RpoP